jgi:hypothetical protein
MLSARFKYVQPPGTWRAGKEKRESDKRKFLVHRITYKREKELASRRENETHPERKQDELERTQQNATMV